MIWAFLFEKKKGLWLIAEPAVIDIISKATGLVGEDFDLEQFVKTNNSQPFWMVDPSKPLPNMCRWQK